MYACKVKIIRYFCIVKYLNSIIKALFVVVFILAAVNSHAQIVEDAERQQMDSVQISLLTCSPGNEVWSLYGHTAIRVFDPAHAQDVVINYGLFNFRQSNFILRFVFGLTDYEMGIEPFDMFMVEYARQGRQVVQQTLQLNNNEKVSILQALAQNYQNDRVYRYNFFYDNCTTRARNILIDNIAGKVNYKVNPNVTSSYRTMIHQWNDGHRWARFGNDLLLGIKADAKTNYVQQQFLPDTLRKDFEEATIVDSVGKSHPLVSSTTVLLKANVNNVVDNRNIWDTITPAMLWNCVFILILLAEIAEYRRLKTFWLIDVTLLTLDGIAGVILLAMVFSQHPTVSFNLQILLLNPLSLVFVYSVINREVKQRFHWYWNILTICILLFFVGNTLQGYAEGMNILALILLSRCMMNRYLLKKS